MAWGLFPLVAVAVLAICVYLEIRYEEPDAVREFWQNF